jgi:hypothetical protein
MGKAIAATPLMLLPVAAYNILALVLGGGLYSTEVGARLTAPVFELRTLSGGLWPVSLSDLLLAAALIVMFVELVKSTRDRRVALINHGLSIVVFVICLAELLLAAAFATSTFFLITLMVLLDVLAGFIVTLVILKRDPGTKAAKS